MAKKLSQPQEVSLQELVDGLLKHVALPAECAEILDMSLDNVRNYCRNGRFQDAMRFGNEWLIPRESIRQYAEKSRGKPGKPKKQVTDEAQ